MAKYALGNYLIVGFDRVGTKLFTKAAQSKTHMRAISEAEQLIQDDECASFVIMRVQYNSMTERNNRWGT